MPSDDNLATPITSNQHAASSTTIPSIRAGTTGANSPPPKVSSCLRVTILSAYDLPRRDPPSGVAITVGDQTIVTGPPVQRHKDRNAFKFATTATVPAALATASTTGTTTTSVSATTSTSQGHATSNQVTLAAPLPDLYRQTVKLQVLYHPSTTASDGGGGALTGAGASSSPTLLETEYALSKLNVHQKTWLILSLDPSRTANQEVDEDNAAVDDTSLVPTLRLHMTLEGPYRLEIAAILQLAQAWFTLVDVIEYNLQQVAGFIPTFPFALDPKFILIPAAPLLAVFVVSLPVIVGVLIIGLPMLLPLLIVLASGVALLLTMGWFLYLSTQSGRRQLQSLLQPALQTLLSTKTGQRLIYQTGPRPTPVNVARAILPRGIWGKLFLSLFIDAMGSASYLIPFVGEITDIGWAPFQTILIMAMYDTNTPRLKYVSFFEEILPLTDILPTATIGWFWEFAIPTVLSRLGWERVPNQLSIASSTTIPNKTTATKATSTTTTGSLDRLILRPTPQVLPESDLK